MKIPFTNIEFGFKNQSEPVKDNRPRKRIKNEQQLYPTRQDVGKWRTAVTSAESIDFPNRTNLYRLYKDIDIDAHVSGVVTNRKNAVLGSDFIVTKNGVEDEEKTKMIQTRWFRDFTTLALDSKFWGHSLIEFGEVINRDFVEFSTIDLVPRQYVKPEFCIVTEYPAQFTGQSYIEPPYSDWCIGVGDKRDLGLYMKVAPLYLWKKGALGAWAEFSDKFGTPMRIGKTDTRDETTRANMATMLANMGSSAWGLFDTDDIVELLETTKTDAYMVFDQMIERCNSEISKLILGQTGTTDEKSFVGSAEVHERISDTYREADEIFIENVYSYQLIPLLNLHGFGFEGCKIEVKEDNELSIEEHIKVDTLLLEHYDIAEDEILERYNRTVTIKEVKPDKDPNSFKNRMDGYYS